MQKKLNRVGILVLLAGCCVGGRVYWSGTSEDAEQATDEYSLLSPDNSKQSRREVEMYGGQMGLLVDSLGRAWEAWMHPKPIGISIAAASGVAALITFLIAHSRSTP